MTLAPSHRYTNEQILAQNGVKGITTHVQVAGMRYSKQVQFTIDIFEWPSWALPQVLEFPHNKGRVIKKIDAKAPVEDAREKPNKVRAGSWR